MSAPVESAEAMHEAHKLILGVTRGLGPKSTLGALGMVAALAALAHGVPQEKAERVILSAMRLGRTVARPRRPDDDA